MNRWIANRWIAAGLFAALMLAEVLLAATSVLAVVPWPPTSLACGHAVS